MSLLAAQNLYDRDQEVIQTLYVKSLESSLVFSNDAGLSFFNGRLAELASSQYSNEELRRIELLLARKGTIDIPTRNNFQVVIDGHARPVSIVAATDTNSNHGDMSSMLYLRDHIQAASALMELYLHDSSSYTEEGKQARTLLLSALHLMSTKRQLERFEDVIVRGRAAGQEDWPHISLYFNDLEARKANGWRNKQDTFQMLAYLTCDAIGRGFLKEEELLESHKKFLANVVPFLQAVGFPLYENSGSWEELTANRTSVLAVETALLCKMRELQEENKLNFLPKHYEVLNALCKAGLQELGRRLPDESPDYKEDSIKYRKADAALIYVLLYDIPKLLEEAHIPIGYDNPQIMTRSGIETIVLANLANLDDSLTRGMIRYKGDSYQRVNFHTNEVQSIVRQIKRRVMDEAKVHGGEINLDTKQRLRDELTPRGREAAWTHPLGQLASWSARRSSESFGVEAPLYRKLSINFLNRLLSMVTDDNQWYTVRNGDGLYELALVPPFRLPECFVTYRTVKGEEFIVSSPHIPLNWSSAMLRQALGLLQQNHH